MKRARYTLEFKLEDVRQVRGGRWRGNLAQQPWQSILQSRIPVGTGRLQDEKFNEPQE